MYSTPPRDLTTQIGRRKRATRFALLLGCLACILLVDSLCSAFVLPLAPGRMAEPSAQLIAEWPLWSFVASLPLPVPRHGHALAVALFVTSVVKFSAYAGAICLAWNQPSGRLSRFAVVGAALLFFVVAVCALPNVNRDIYNYIISGRVAAVHGANPYQVPPDRFPADPIYQYASSRYMGYPGDNKLPMWMLLNVGLARLGGDSPVANLLLYRAAFLLINLANLGLIARILQAVQPRRVLAGLVLYAWNPIVIAHGQSKVDTLMVLFLLLAALALVRENRKLAVVVLGVSAMVKLITLPLLAVYCLYELRSRGPRALAISILLSGLTAIAIYAPFWYGPELLGMQIRLLGDMAAGPDLVRFLLYAGFGLGAVWVGLSRDGRAENMLTGWALVLVLFALMVTKLGFSWYLLTLIALASLVMEPRLVLLVIALSFVSFLLNAWDSASNETMQLPILFEAPRFYMHLLFACMSVLGLAALEIGWRARQRQSAEYSIDGR